MAKKSVRSGAEQQSAPRVRFVRQCRNMSVLAAAKADGPRFEILTLKRESRAVLFATQKHSKRAVELRRVQFGDLSVNHK